MANTRSAKKMVRKIARRTEVNTARRSRVRTYVRRVEDFPPVCAREGPGLIPAARK